VLAIAANAPWLVEKTSDMGKAWMSMGKANVWCCECEWGVCKITCLENFIGLLHKYLFHAALEPGFVPFLIVCFIFRATACYFGDSVV